MPKKVTLTDDSIMAFGKFKGAKLADVPDSWLKWWYKENKPLIEYIESSFEEKELRP